jgi:Flp pilus assembly protein CpaB
MWSRTAFAAAVAVVTLTVAAMYFANRRDQPPPAPEMVRVLVASRDLQWGELLKHPEELFELEDRVKGSASVELVEDLASLKGRQLKISLRRGDTIRPEDLIASAEPWSWPISVRLRVDLNGTSAASWPRKRVDVIHTVAADGRWPSYSEVLLVDVPILAVEDTTQQDETGQYPPGNIATFLLWGNQVLRLKDAQDIGSFTITEHRPAITPALAKDVAKHRSP